MKTTDFAKHLKLFLISYLPGEKGFSPNTIVAYRDTFKQFLIFIEIKLNINSDKFTLEQFNVDNIKKFLNYIENECECSVSTRNQRLAAIRSFANYVKRNDPTFLLNFQQISQISIKKVSKPILLYLTPDNIASILKQPNINKKEGRRDLAILSLLYDSGARVQELCDLCIRDFRNKPPHTITLTGKGSKSRIVPIMPETADVIAKYLIENKLLSPEKLNNSLFSNHHRTKFTRAGITYILNKYANSARIQDPSIPLKISPHTLRHSKAMHMLQANVNLIYIRDFLGHAQVKTTEIYAKADIETKRSALERCRIPVTTELPNWSDDKPLMDMLREICR